MSDRVFVEDAKALPSAVVGENARPKVMRRPQHFSNVALNAPVDAASRSENTAEAMAVIPTAAPRSHNTRVWYEDTRFGLLLIVTLVLLNGLLGALVPYLSHTVMKQEIENDTILLGDSALPEAKRQESRVTTYADPTAAARLRTQFDLEEMNPAQNALSVSPHDIPAPRARALDRNDESR